MFKRLFFTLKLNASLDPAFGPFGKDNWAANVATSFSNECSVLKFGWVQYAVPAHYGAPGSKITVYPGGYMHHAKLFLGNPTTVALPATFYTLRNRVDNLRTAGAEMLSISTAVPRRFGTARLEISIANTRNITSAILLAETIAAGEQARIDVHSVPVEAVTARLYIGLPGAPKTYLQAVTGAGAAAAGGLGGVAGGVANTVPAGWSLASSHFVTPNLFVDAIAGVVHYRHSALDNWNTSLPSDRNPVNRHTLYTQINWRHHQLLVA